MFDQQHNFYKTWCQPTEQWHYLAPCLKRTETKPRAEDYPACNAAFRNGTCPACVIRGEELGALKTLYYLDRDDAGPGVISRSAMGISKRSDEMRAAHHEVLDDLGITPDERESAAVPPPTYRTYGKKRTAGKVVSKAKPAPVHKPAPAAPSNNAFDIGALITEAVTGG